MGSPKFLFFSLECEVNDCILLIYYYIIYI